MKWGRVECFGAVSHGLTIRQEDKPLNQTVHRCFPAISKKHLSIWFQIGQKNECTGPSHPIAGSSTIAILPFCHLQASLIARKVRRPPYHIKNQRNLQHVHPPYRHHSRCDCSDTSGSPPRAFQTPRREQSLSGSPEIHGTSVWCQSPVFLIVGQNFT